MTIRGIIQSAELQENPPGSDRVELLCWLQGVGPRAPRRFVIPFAMLVADETLDPESIAGHAFEAEIEEVEPRRWEVRQIQFAARNVLRPKDGD